MSSPAYRENAHERQSWFLALKRFHSRQTAADAGTLLRLVLRLRLGDRVRGRVFVVEEKPLWGEEGGWTFER